MTSYTTMMRATLMLLLLAGLMVVATPSTTGTAENSGMRASASEVKHQLVAVVEAQLAAFRSGDTVKAYSYASRALRAQWPLRTFAAIVEANYPEIWANTRAEFGIAYDDGERAKIAVVVYADEERRTYEYMFVRERAGWRVEGVGVLRRAPQKGGRI